MHYYLYEVKNILNNKIYVGVHKTTNLDDGYMGSGKVIQHAIKKYGVENFIKVILETFEDSKSMYAKEKEIVTDDFLLREDVYNLRRGGFGGFDHINKIDQNRHDGEQNFFYKNTNASKLGNNARKELHKNPEFREKLSQNISKGIKESYPEGRQSSFSELNKDPGFQVKRKRKFKEINHQQGNKNSQYGTMWITNGKENKKIKKTDVIPIDWYPGRKSKE